MKQRAYQVEQLHPYDRRCMMPHAEEWLEVLLKRWTSLTPAVRGQLQTSMGLPSRDRKNQRRLEKKLKTAAGKSEPSRHDTAGRKVHS